MCFLSVVLVTDDLGGNITMVVSQPWFIATLASIMLVTIILITVWLWRRRQKQKQSASITKGRVPATLKILIT